MPLTKEGGYKISGKPKNPIPPSERKEPEEKGTVQVTDVVSDYRGSPMTSMKLAFDGLTPRVALEIVRKALERDGYKLTADTASEGTGSKP